MNTGVFWGAIAILYLTLSVFHYWWAFSEHSRLKRQGISKVSGVSTGIVEITEHKNKHTKQSNLIQATGFFVAFLVALFSLITTIN